MNIPYQIDNLKNYVDINYKNYTHCLIIIYYFYYQN